MTVMSYRTLPGIHPVIGLLGGEHQIEVDRDLQLHIDLTEHAAWTVVSQLILNLDEALTRG